MKDTKRKTNVQEKNYTNESNMKNTEKSLQIIEFVGKAKVKI